MKRELCITIFVASLAIAAPAQVLNPGFELPGPTSSGATNWNVTQAAGGPVYAVRTNTSPRTGSHHLEVKLASTGAGPVVEVQQSGIPVTGGAAYPFTFYSKAVTGSAGYNAQWRVVWNAGGETGFRGFTPGNNTYAMISNSITAPAAATSASLFLYFAGAATPSQSALIHIDDVSWGSTNVVEDPVDPGLTNAPVVSISRASEIRWFASNSVTYQVQWASEPPGPNTEWHNWGNAIIGNGQSRAVVDSTGPPRNFFRVLSFE